VTLEERLRQLASALPSDQSAVSLTRVDLLALLEEDRAPAAPMRDLTVEDVAEETGRAPSTVRGWLLAGALRGYKISGRDWRVPSSALRDYLTGQTETGRPPTDSGDVDITAWRRELGA
jgi:excisionase family DNA binding protein